MNEFENLKQLLSDQNYLKDKLSFIAIYVCIYEKYTDIIVERIRELFTVFSVKDSNLIEEISSDYETKIVNRKFGIKKRRNILLASMLHFVELGAISENDYKVFELLRDRRNKYTHEMTAVLLEDLTDEDINALLDMLEMFKKLDTWWLTEYEAPIGGIDPEIYKDGYSLAWGLYVSIIDKLFLENNGAN